MPLLESSWVSGCRCSRLNGSLSRYFERPTRGRLVDAASQPEEVAGPLFVAEFPIRRRQFARVCGRFLVHWLNGLQKVFDGLLPLARFEQRLAQHIIGGVRIGIAFESDLVLADRALQIALEIEDPPELRIGAVIARVQGKGAAEGL